MIILRGANYYCYEVEGVVGRLDGGQHCVEAAGLEVDLVGAVAATDVATDAVGGVAVGEVDLEGGVEGGGGGGDGDGDVGRRGGIRIAGDTVVATTGIGMRRRESRRESWPDARVPIVRCRRRW